MHGYEVKLWYSRDDRCYVAQAINLPGCAVDGSTPEEALAHLREAIPAWIEAMRSNGHPIPAPSLPVEIAA